MKPVLAWHFIRPGFALGYGDTRVPKIGEWLEHDGPVVLCERGLHASVRAIDAFEFYRWSDGLLCRVELDGAIIRHEDGKKLVATRRRIIWAVPADPLLWQWLLNVATRALEQHYPDAPEVLWAAIDLRAAMLEGVEVEDAEKAAAGAAARAVAGAASGEVAAAAWAASVAASGKAGWAGSGEETYEMQ